MTATAGSLTTVPLLDLVAVNRAVKADVLEEIGQLIDTGAFTGGPQVRRFERAFAAYCGTEYCVGVASGLDALRLGLLAAGIERGDEVLVAANTFVATLEAVTQGGGTPVVVDASLDDWNLDPDGAEAAITGRTRFIAPTHLYGQLADLAALHRIADKHGVRVIEDACQAHGAIRDSVVPGRRSLGAAFSFYPSKNLGAFGDAGAFVTPNRELAGQIHALREHGQTRKHVHDREGYTARLDTIQALVLLRKLGDLDAQNAERRALAERYSARLDGVGDLRLPPVPSGSNPVWHVYVVRTAHPDALAAYLDERGIAAGRHYPTPVHLTPAYRWLGHRPGEFPVAEALAAEVLSLPLFPGMTDAQFDAVVESITAFFGGARYSRLGRG